MRIYSNHVNYRMKTITIDVPEIEGLDKNEVRMILASKLYEQGKLSLGQAAELAELPKRAFAELLASYNVSIFNYPASEIGNDVKNA